MSLKRHLLTIMAVAGVASAGLSLAVPTRALAGSPSSTACEDNSDDIPILTSPITLGVEIGYWTAPVTSVPHVAICYATSPYGYTGPETTGGVIAVDALTGPTTYSNPNGNTVNASCTPDGNQQGVALSCSVGTSPTYSVNPGPPGTNGDTITVSVPFTVCLGPCTNSGTGLNPTGLLVGQLAPAPQPGIGFGYSLQSLDVYVNGALVFHEQPVTVAGAYVDPLGAIEESLNFQQGGPCSSGVCVPQGYVGTTGNNLVGFTVLGVPFNYAPSKACPYYNPSTSYCP